MLPCLHALSHLSSYTSIYYTSFTKDIQPGIVRMIRLAQQYFWWPGIDSCVNSHVQKCFICQTSACKSTNARLSSWAEPNEFLERVHVDVAHYCGKPYLLLIDVHSKWVDMQLLNDLTSLSTIAALHSTFKYIGLPVCLVSDNGTNFVSQEFISFLRADFIRLLRYYSARSANCSCQSPTS